MTAGATIVLILARDAAEIHPLQAGIKLRWDASTLEEAPSIVVPCREADDPRRWFTHVAARMTDLCGRGQLTVAVGMLDPLALNPLQATWEALLAMLILAFPEAAWSLGTHKCGRPRSDSESEDLKRFSQDNGIQTIFATRASPLFDASGLRDWVRDRMHKVDEIGTDLAYLPRRRVTAVTLDEERNYSTLHAYTAYRFGFRGIPVWSRQLASAYLGSAAAHRQVRHGLTIEDIYVSFPDGGSGYSDLGGARREEFPLLETARDRIFVTSGQILGDPRGEEVRTRNETYLKAQRERGASIEQLYKPCGGIFRLWEMSGLLKSLPRGSDRLVSGHERGGCAPGYVWPPRPRGQTAARSTGHSAPGVLLEVATHLVERAEKLKQEAATLHDTLRGAVLATDALELLGFMTPTSSIEALRLRHEFEAMAECKFSGVAHHFHLEPRIEEIEHEVNAITHWFDPGPQRTAELNAGLDIRGRIAQWRKPNLQKIAELNARMNILSRIVLVFRDHGRFDEEQICLEPLRTAQRHLWMSARWWRWGFRPFIWYVHTLISSLPKFIIVVAIWLAGLTLLYVATFPGFEQASTSPVASVATSASAAATAPNRWSIALQDATTSFFSVGEPKHQAHPGREGYTGWQMLVICLSIVGGFLHLGVFVSHLYTLASRR